MSSNPFLVALLMMCGVKSWWQIKIAASFEREEGILKGIAAFIFRLLREICCLTIALTYAEISETTFCILFKFWRTKTSPIKKFHGVSWLYAGVCLENQRNSYV